VWPPLAQAANETGGFRELIDSLARTPLSQVVAFVVICTILRLAIYPFLRKTPQHLRSGGYTVARFGNELLDAVIYAGVFVFLLIRPFAVQAFLIPSTSMIDTLLVNDFIVANKAIYRYSDPKVGDIVVFKPPVWATNADQRDPNGEVKVDFIKRCQGTAGDTVEVKGGHLYRNGHVVDEPYLKDPQMLFDWKLVQYHGVKKEWDGKYIPVIIEGDFGSEPNYNVGSGIAKPFAVGAAPEDASSPESGVRGWKMRNELTQEENTVISELKNLPPAKVPPGYFLMMGDNRNGSYDGRAWGLVPRENIIGRSEFIWLPFNRWQRTKSVRTDK
jgi:signal peptidase I